MSTMYVLQMYGSSATVVFDGYDEGPTTKDCAHNRRQQGRGPEVNFTRDMICRSKKDHFLSNASNKKKIISLIRECLLVRGIRTTTANADADLSIVQTAIQLSNSSTVAVI